MKIFGISGSLRAASTNTALVRAAAMLAPAGAAFTVYDGLGNLPHYSPELDGDEPPLPVQELRNQIRAADAVLICTPEYAHGMPGSLKNLLDWLVSSGEMDGKPMAALSASPSILGGDKAHAWLTQTLSVLGARIPDGATLCVPFVRTKFDAEGSLSDLETAQALRAVFDALANVVADGKLP